MTKISIIRPPKINADTRKGFWKQLGMIVLGATISLMLTILAAQMLELHQRAKDRKLSAMMVLSNIEKFARTLEEHAEVLAHNDTIATWLLSKPLEELELMPQDELNSLINQATSTFFLTYDKSAEHIFSNNIDTWKNMGNVQFIDQVGQCFSAMNQIEEYWNNRMTDANATLLEIKDHPEDYEGSTTPIKILGSEKMRRTLRGTHYMQSWLTYTAAAIRYHNRNNMKAIGISEKKVMKFTDDRESSIDNQTTAPEPGEFYTDPIAADRLTSMGKYDSILNQLTAGSLSRP